MNVVKRDAQYKIYTEIVKESQKRGGKITWKRDYFHVTSGLRFLHVCSYNGEALHHSFNLNNVPQVKYMLAPIVVALLLKDGSDESQAASAIKPPRLRATPEFHQGRKRRKNK
jgi:hypothetical protein